MNTKRIPTNIKRISHEYQMNIKQISNKYQMAKYEVQIDLEMTGNILLQPIALTAKSAELGRYIGLFVK